MIWTRILAVACLVLTMGLGVQTWRVDRLKAAPVRERLKVVEKVVERQAQAAAITEAVGRQVAEREAEIRYVTRTLIQEIPVHVTAEADRASPVPLGFVRLHDAAAAGAPTVSYGPGESADDASGVALSAVTGVVADNYGTCLGWREQVIGWQAWYAEQRARWDSG